MATGQLQRNWPGDCANNGNRSQSKTTTPAGSLKMPADDCCESRLLKQRVDERCCSGTTGDDQGRDASENDQDRRQPPLLGLIQEVGKLSKDRGTPPFSTLFKCFLVFTHDFAFSLATCLSCMKNFVVVNHALASVATVWRSYARQSVEQFLLRPRSRLPKIALRVFGCFLYRPIGLCVSIEFAMQCVTTNTPKHECHWNKQ